MNVDVLQLAEKSDCWHVTALSPGNSRYAGDCCIRHWKGKHWSELATLLGVVDEEYVITGGIGTLILRKNGNSFLPVPTIAPTPRPQVNVEQEESNHRMVVCITCKEYRPLADKCNFCGCSHAMTEYVKSSFSKCPDGKW